MRVPWRNFRGNSHSGARLYIAHFTKFTKFAIHNVITRFPFLYAIRFVSLTPQQILRLFFFIFAAGFAFALSNFAHYYVVIFNAPLSDRDVCDGLRFPGNLDISSLTPRGLIVPLVCGFRRRYNLLAWRELFANLYDLYEPKSLNLAFQFGRNTTTLSDFIGFID